MIRKIRAELAREHVDMFFAKMKELGYSEQDAVDLVKKKYEGEKE